jgi:hypothetical protein
MRKKNPTFGEKIRIFGKNQFFRKKIWEKIWEKGFHTEL